MQNELEKARSEWDDVAEIVPTFQGERDEDRPKEITSKDIYREVPLVTTEDILKDFRENYLETVEVRFEDGQVFWDARRLALAGRGFPATWLQRRRK